MVRCKYSVEKAILNLSELPHPLHGYRTFGMEGQDGPGTTSLVKYLVVDYLGEPIGLKYQSSKRMPEPKPLAKALAKGGAGIAATMFLTRQFNRGQRLTMQQRLASDDVNQHVAKEIGERVGNWMYNDLKEAFDPRRGEGYYRLDSSREKFYDVPIYE